MLHTPLAIFMMVGLLLSLAQQGSQQPAAAKPKAHKWDFDHLAVGAGPPGFTIAQTGPAKSKATWAVMADSDAPSQPNVLALTHTENRGRAFNLLIADAAEPADLDLSVKVKAHRGKEDQGGGLIWRCRDENNYYVCRVNPLEGNYRVYKVEGGERTMLESASIELHSNQWYTLRVTMMGEHITCYLDGKKLLEATDSTFKDAGRVGLWTKADAHTAFDDLTVGHAETADKPPQK